MANLTVCGNISYNDLDINKLFDTLQSFAIGNIEPASSIRMRSFDIDMSTPLMINGVEYYDMYFPDANGKMSFIYDIGKTFQAYVVYSSCVRKNQEILIFDGNNENISWMFCTYGPASNFHNDIILLNKLDLVPTIDDYEYNQHSGNIQKLIHNWIIDNNINASFETSIDEYNIHNIRNKTIDDALFDAINCI